MPYKQNTSDLMREKTVKGIYAENKNSKPIYKPLLKDDYF